MKLTKYRNRKCKKCIIYVTILQKYTKNTLGGKRPRIRRVGMIPYNKALKVSKEYIRQSQYQAHIQDWGITEFRKN